MTIAGSDADSCSGTLDRATLELHCKESSLCAGDDCVPFEFDGTTLSFAYGVGRVSCTAQKP